MKTGNNTKNIIENRTKQNRTEENKNKTKENKTKTNTKTKLT